MTKGVTERVTFRPSAHGVPIITLSCPHGTAEVSLLGAQTISYRPAGGRPVLYMPHAYDATEAGREIHGGIPVCWPWFARDGAPGSKMHGVARYACWRVLATDCDSDATSITLGLASDDTTRAVWPHDFELEFTISLSTALALSLRATNTGADAFAVTEGFHPYFLVSDRDRTEVRGVDGCTYRDLRAPEKGLRVWTGDCPVRSGGSKAFDVSSHDHQLIDHGFGRTIAVASKGNRRLVVWNPGAESADRAAEFGTDGWRKFVCVEPCTTPTDAAYALKPGESHTLEMIVREIGDCPVLIESCCFF